MPLTAGYDVTVYDPVRGLTLNLIIDRGSYSSRFSNPAIPRAGMGGEYTQYAVVDVTAIDDFRAGVGQSEWSRGGLAASTGLDGQSPHKLVLAPAPVSAALGGTVHFITTYRSSGSFDVYAGAGTGTSAKVYKFNPTGSTWSSIYTFTSGTNPYLRAEVFNAYLYVARGMADNAYRYDGSTWTATTWKAERLQRCGKYLWRSTSAGTPSQASVSKSADGTTWDPDIPVGLANTSINALAVMGGELYIAKPEGLFKISDNTEALEVLQFPLYDERNGIGMISHQDILYIPMGDGHLLRYTGSTVTDIALPAPAFESAYFRERRGEPPPYGEWVDTPYWGRIVGLAGAGNIYASLLSNNYYLLYVCTGVSWHLWRQTSATPTVTFLPMCHAANLTNASGKRYLFVATGDAGDTILAYTLPPTTDDIAFGCSSFLGEAYGFFPFCDAGLPRLTKCWFAITVLADVPADCTVRVGYRTAESSPPTPSGFTFLTSYMDEGSAEKTFYFPSPVTARRLQPAVKLVSVGGSATPAVHAVLLHYVPYTPGRYRVFTFRVRAGGDTEHGPNLDAEELQATLKVLASADHPLQYSDFTGISDALVNLTNVVPQVLQSPSGTDSDILFATSWMEVATPYEDLPR